MSTLSFPDFLQTPPGVALRRWESAQYAEQVQDVFGLAALQIGMPVLDTLHANRIRLHGMIDCDETALHEAQLRNDFEAVLADSAELPFRNETFDLVTMPHVLDFSASAHRSLSEAARVLAPEGRLVITGFNPMGLWWQRQRCVCLGLSPYLPSRAVPIAVHRLKDWLNLLGFEIDRGRFGIYSPACRSTATLARWRWLDKAGDRWAPHCANLYMLSAVKRQPGVRPLVSSALQKAREAITGRPRVSVVRAEKAENGLQE